MTRTVEVDPERLDRWFAGFASRHGEITWCEDLARAEDGCTALRGPLPLRRRGLLLVRLGGYAIGVADGAELVASKVGQRPVHGRNAAGGWSQQRFARRREGQVKVALSATAEHAARLLGMAELDAVTCGGDRTAVDAVLADPRLGSLRPLVETRLLDVPDPKRSVLEEALRRARKVRIELTDSAGCAESR